MRARLTGPYDAVGLQPAIGANHCERQGGVLAHLLGKAIGVVAAAKLLAPWIEDSVSLHGAFAFQVKMVGEILRSRTISNLRSNKLLTR